MINCELIKTLPVGNELGEGITWHPQQKAVWWTDINGQRLYRYQLNGQTLQSWPMPERVGCFGFVEDSDRLIVAFASGLAFYEVESGSIEWIVKPEEERQGNRFNDGKVGPDGRFYAGCMVEDNQQANLGAGFYRLDKQGDCRRLFDGIAISNGLCWSPDGKTMYHADSPTKQIVKYDFDLVKGTPSNPQIFAQIQAYCVPDGATVDAQGGVWVALWGGAEVVRFAPDGQISHQLQLPVSQPTCVCFGGDNLDLLFVTSASVGLGSKGPQDGNVFIYETNVRGLAPTFFQPHF